MDTYHLPQPLNLERVGTYRGRIQYTNVCDVSNEYEVVKEGLSSIHEILPEYGTHPGYYSLKRAIFHVGGKEPPEGSAAWYLSQKGVSSPNLSSYSSSFHLRVGGSCDLAFGRRMVLAKFRPADGGLDQKCVCGCRGHLLRPRSPTRGSTLDRRLATAADFSMPKQ